MKRAYYNSQVDKDFEKTFDFKSEEERNEYFEYCAMYSSFGKGEIVKSRARSLKQIFYFLFLLALPLRIPYTSLIFMTAAILSIFEKTTNTLSGPNTGNIMSRIFTNEEVLNLALILMLLFSPLGVKLLLYLCMALFAFMQWCDWACEMLEESKAPGAKPVYGLPALQPVIEFGMIFRVELTKGKSHLEVFIAFLSVYLIFIGRIAPIFPIFFWQYLRIKYVVSAYTQMSFRELD